jgi:hypothetical protein
MGKKMLALTVNAAAEKIIRQELQTAGRAGALSGGSRRGSCFSRSPMAAPMAGQHSGGSARQSIGAAGKRDIQGRGAQRRRSAAEVNGNSREEKKL